MACLLGLFLLAAPGLAEEAKPLSPAQLSRELLYRVWFGNSQDVRLLVLQGADPNTVNADGIPALCLAARRQDEGGISIMQALLDSGAQIEKGDKQGRTALAYAAMNGNAQGVMFLLEKGAIYYQRDKNDNNARNLAFTSGYPEIGKMIDRFALKKIDERMEEYNQRNRIIAAQYALLAEQQKQVYNQQQAMNEVSRRAREIAEKRSQEARQQEAQLSAEEQKSRAAQAVALEAERQATLQALIEKRKPERLKRFVSEIAYNSCVGEYLSFVDGYHIDKRPTDTEIAELREESKRRYMEAATQIITDFGVNQQYVQDISTPSGQAIIKQLETLRGLFSLKREGVGPAADMEKRCLALADSWAVPQ